MSRDSPSNETVGQATDGLKTTSSDGVLEDTVGGVAYYHCPAQQQPTVDLVLLHGAAFTKENWKSSGILTKLCHVPKLSVTALDLNHRGNHKDFQNVLDGLRQEKLIHSDKPVALVTPSASGYSVVDWISTGNVDELQQYVKYWIPVASPAIKRADKSALEGIKGRLDILAIYGSEDKGGKVVSEKLESLAGAKVVEISGSHPCYLDSPDDFITHVLDFIK